MNDAPTYYTSSHLAQLCKVTPQAITMRVKRGTLTPDAWAWNGTRHMALFTYETCYHLAEGAKR